MSRILVIGDTHIPFAHPKYFDHCVKIARENECDTFVHVGDVVDNHSISYHEKDTGLPSPDEELSLARKRLIPWVQAFPGCKVCIGNHDELPTRKHRTAGLPSITTIGYNNYYQTEGWDWKREHIIPAFRHRLWFRHGWPKSVMLKGGTGGYSTICGHYHAESGFKWSQFPSHSAFSLYIGCGVNFKHKAFDYARLQEKLPVMSCATIINGQPAVHRMF